MGVLISSALQGARKPTPSTIGSILAINPMDARAIHDALVQ